MKPHPTYLAAFQGGPHPVHPNNKAWHSQYIKETVAYDLYREGRLIEGGDLVLSLIGSHFWYKPTDFICIIENANDAKFRLLAITILRQIPSAAIV